jgi:hypothetical protein
MDQLAKAKEQLLISQEINEKAWSKLDDEFHESEDNITALVLEYVRKNRAEFRWGQEKKRVSLSIKYLKSIFNT